MPYDDPDPSDPTMLVGVILPGGPEAMREMAYVFAEEFARTGMDEGAILDLFMNPFYAGPHRAYRALGADAVGAIIGECVAVWGRTAGPIRDGQAARRQDVQWLGWPTVAGAAPMPDAPRKTTSSMREGA